ncbi:LAGLIDADG family homing endonuclease [Oceanobacillus caeni]|uniref:LAGLIDADG family homing endonuclease n=1 Tax=Oceanobacillus caeni TaxID=405946 RepID=UPI0030B874A8
MRGYFDGDGYVNYEKYTVTFVGGSVKFLRSIKQILLEQGFKPQFIEDNNNFRVHIRGRRSIKFFSDWIYKDKGIYLLRKYESFQKEKLSIEQLQDSVHDTTNVAVSMRKLKFLSIYTLTKSVNYTCECLNIKPTTFKRWIKSDELFRFNFNKIEEG